MILSVESISRGRVISMLFREEIVLSAATRASKSRKARSCGIAESAGKVIARV
jgi:hypothetical protein